MPEEILDRMNAESLEPLGAELTDALQKFDGSIEAKRGHLLRQEFLCELPGIKDFEILGLLTPAEKSHRDVELPAKRHHRPAPCGPIELFGRGR